MTTTAPTRTERDFDHPDRLNEDGTVTLEIVPSNWHAYNISPDTYNIVPGYSTTDYELARINEMDEDDFKRDFGIPRPDEGVEYDDFQWTYDHPAIVEDFAEVLCDWITEQLWDEFEEFREYPTLIWDAEKGKHYYSEDCSVLSGKVVNTWSPAYHNFTSDGFEMKLTIHPETLRKLTADFDVNAWVHEHYRSYDGFHSFVTGRMDDDEWAAQYDGEFRIEYLFAKVIDADHDQNWIYTLAEAEDEVYMNHTTTAIDVDNIRERYGYRGTTYLLSEIEEWAAEITASLRANTDPLFECESE